MKFLAANRSPVAEKERGAAESAKNSPTASADGLAGLAFLGRIAALAPDPEAAAFRLAVERAECGATFAGCFDLPATWRRRERDRLLGLLAAWGLSPEAIEAEWRKGKRSAFAETVARIDRLSRRDPDRCAEPLSARQIRRIVSDILAVPMSEKIEAD